MFDWVLNTPLPNFFVDVDECKNPLLNGCSQICHNTVGSFTCSCNKGYRLNNNKRSCDDINECAENKHNCQHNCHNNVGSFTCSCRAGYKLSADRKSCVGMLTLFTITTPSFSLHLNILQLNAEMSISLKNILIIFKSS